MPSRRGRVYLVCLTGLLTYVLFFWTPEGDRSLDSFDPEKLARLEMAVWQSREDQDVVRLFLNTVVMLREQDRYSWAKAIDAGFHLSRALHAFPTTRTHVERLLPDLERVYRIERDWVGSDFDPAEAARAELSSWIARRRPELKTPDYIGTLIAERDGYRFSLPTSSLFGAAHMRARAAMISDEERPDWDAVSQILKDSYRTLHEVVRSETRTFTSR